MKHITRTDWEVAGCFRDIAEPGDTVAYEIIDELRNALPPLMDRLTYLQCGEPCCYAYDSERDSYRPTFMTFRQEDPAEPWVYLGTCFPGGIEHRRGYI